MGMRGYRGSPAEREDRAEGIKVGGQVRWLVWPKELVGIIRKIEFDADGDPWFHLTFENHKDIRAEWSEIAPLTVDDA